MTNILKKITQDSISKIFIFLILLPATYNFYPGIKKFPDYDAYETMFNSWDNLPNVNWGPLYILINHAFKFLGSNYFNFRVYLYLVSAFFIITSFFIIKRKYYILVKFNYYQAIGFLVAIEFYIEFLLIRIRAGLGISVATLGVCIFIANRNYFLTFLLIFISYFIHSFSAVVVAFMLIPAILSKNNNNLDFNINLVLLGTFIIFCAEIASEYRGFNVYSKLNIYRFIAISPVAFFVYLVNCKFVDRDESIFGFDGFINNLVILYLSLMFGVFVTYFSGVLNNSGEGLLRIIYIFDIFWIFALVLTKSRYRLTIAYIASINAVFFIYSVFLR